MELLLGAPDYALVGTLIARKDDGRALVLMREKLVIRQDHLAAFLMVTAFELDFGQQVPRHAVNPVELALVAAVGARVGVSLEPVGLTVAAEGLLARFALYGVFKHVVADVTDEFLQEAAHVRPVDDQLIVEHEL